MRTVVVVGLVKAEGQFADDGRAVFICSFVQIVIQNLQLRYNMDVLYSFVQIAIQNLQLRYNMDVLYSIEDLIAAFGGLFGLCTGASLLRSHPFTAIHI